MMAANSKIKNKHFMALRSYQTSKDKPILMISRTLTCWCAKHRAKKHLYSEVTPVHSWLTTPPHTPLLGQLKDLDRIDQLVACVYLCVSSYLIAKVCFFSDQIFIVQPLSRNTHTYEELPGAG